MREDRSPLGVGLYTYFRSDNYIITAFFKPINICCVYVLLHE
jgi:hypothetical protein